MVVSPQAKSAMDVFKLLKKLGVLSKTEKFDRFYVWMREVEAYAETYCESD